MNRAMLCALLAAAVAWLLVPGRVSLPTPRPVRRPRGHAWAAPAGGAGAVVLAGAVLGARAGLWCLLAVEVSLSGWHLARAQVHARHTAGRREEVAQATQVVAGQLRIGAVPSTALAHAARDCTALEGAAATQRIGGDVGQALLRVGAEEGREGLQSLARAWELAERTGAPMAALAGQVGEQVRADRQTSQVVQAELSGPRATARLLAGLPLVGLAMARMVGGHPVTFLTGSLPGLCCLAVGVGLACAGVLWTEQMAAAAQEV